MARRERVPDAGDAGRGTRRRLATVPRPRRGRGQGEGAPHNSVAIRSRMAASGSRPAPAFMLSSRCSGLPVPGMTQVTARVGQDPLPQEDGRGLAVPHDVDALGSRAHRVHRPMHYYPSVRDEPETSHQPRHIFHLAKTLKCASLVFCGARRHARVVRGRSRVVPRWPSPRRRRRRRRRAARGTGPSATGSADPGARRRAAARGAPEDDGRELPRHRPLGRLDPRP